MANDAGHRNKRIGQETGKASPCNVPPQERCHGSDSWASVSSFQRLLKVKIRLARIFHSAYESNSQTIPAAETVAGALWVLSPFHSRTAKPNSPTQPTEAPAESRLAATRPRFVPSELICALRLFSWLSIKLVPAGNIAGKARKRPPTPGPKCFAIKPAKTVHKPPNKNLAAYSCGLVSFRADRSTSILFTIAPRPETTSQRIRRTRSA